MSSSMSGCSDVVRCGDIVVQHYCMPSAVNANVDVAVDHGVYDAD